MHHWGGADFTGKQECRGILQQWDLGLQEAGIMLCTRNTKKHMGLGQRGYPLVSMGKNMSTHSAEVKTMGRAKVQNLGISCAPDGGYGLCFR